MAFAIADRVQETTTTQGTGTVVLAGAVTGYQSFAIVGNANTTYYTIADQIGPNWEVGIGTYYLGNTSLARTTILASSNSNAAVNFGLGTKAVFVTYPAEKAIYSNDSNLTTITNFASGNVAITGGTINGVTISNATYSGLGTMAYQNANAVTITSGFIDGTAIGGFTPNSGAFTTVNAASATIANLASSNVSITGGTINGVTISNATYSGLGTMSTQNANNVNITGGTIATTNVSTANLIATGGTLNNVIIGGTTPVVATFTNVTANSVTVSNGTYSKGIFQGAYTDGIVVDYITGNGRISVGAADNVSIYNSGVANVNLLTINTVGAFGVGNTASFGTAGQVLTSNGSTGSVYWAAGGGGGGSTGIGNSSILALNVNITANATINAGVNGFSVGPVNTANGVVVTITSGQRWVII